MTNEISEEAKRSLADVARRKAADRLRRDGAHSMDAVRRRVRAIAEERKLPPAEYAKLMYKRISTGHAVAFCEKHRISMDWLLCGDLQGLLRTAQGCPSRPRQEASTALPFAYTSEEFVEAINQLDPKAREFITGYMRLLLDGGGAA
jgi:hypothetical protein